MQSNARAAGVGYDLVVPHSPSMASVHPIASRRSPSADKAAELLGAALAAPTAAQAESHLGELVSSHVEPLVFRIVSTRMRRHHSKHHSQIEDVSSEAVVSFLLHVEEVREGRAARLENLDAFVATLAARACNDYFRQAHPAFHALRNKLRYLMERYPELARWKDPASGQWMCGLAAWQGPGKPALRAAAHVDEMDGLAAALKAKHPADQLMQVFVEVNAPIPFNDLALLMARLWNVQEAAVEVEEEQEFADPGRGADVTLAQRQWLGVLWKRIAELNRNQRLALLLNLKGPEGSCGASLLVTSGVTTIRQIAQAVEMPDAEFADLWERLPLNDLEISTLLALTRQQVINLRKCARQRLTRQMNMAEQKEW